LIKTYEIFDSYEKRFAAARLIKPFSLPTEDEARQEIVRKTKKMLGYDEALLPRIGKLEEMASEEFGTYCVTQLRYETWKNTYGCASLYLPRAEGKLPLAFLVCGHGAQGRLSAGYRLMAHRLAGMGIAVIVPDNIGQGDRERMGHWHSVGPFYAGLTLQGLIVMETIALIRYLSLDERFDAKRLAALGNSGGGTLTLMLAALCPELSVLSGSGYPSEFHYILSKERHHCSCNLLRGCAVAPEMWEIYSLFAPKPMLLAQGVNDGLIPVEYFLRNERKLRGIYSLMGAEDKLETAVTPTTHPWDKEDREVICDFIARHLGVGTENNIDPKPAFSELPESWRVELPENAITTDLLSEQLSGAKMPEGTALKDIFVPAVNGIAVDESEIIRDLGRGDVMQVFAQMECALTVVE